MMEPSIEFVPVGVKEEQIDNQVSSSHLPSSSGVDKVTDADRNSHLMMNPSEDPLKVEVKEELCDDQTYAALPLASSQLSSGMGHLRHHSEDALSQCGRADIKEEDIWIKDEPVEDLDLIAGSTTTFTPKPRSTGKMVYADLPDDIYHASLAVLADELLAANDEMEAVVVMVAQRGEMLQRLVQEEEERRQQPTRVEGYVEHTIPLFNNQEFKAHFRMERGTFEQLQQVLGPHLTTRIVSVEKKILATLWLLSNKESFRGVADRFDLNKGFLHNICMEVCEALKLVQPQFITWPTRQEQTQIAHNFLHKTGFPGVVGCIDGTHIPIPGPSDHRDSYINQKGFPSLQVQAVCDDNLHFLDVYTGWPGSVADARVFRNSPLRKILEDGNLDEEHHLLGDSGYGLAPYMMVPFKDDGHLTGFQVNYNMCHSSARVVIERAFGLLKSKFRRLQYLDMRLVKKIPLVILSSCVLHNFILLTEKIDLEFDVQNIQIDENAPHEVAQEQGDIIAMNKRNTLANLLA